MCWRPTMRVGSASTLQLRSRKSRSEEPRTSCRELPQDSGSKTIPSAQFETVQDHLRGSKEVDNWQRDFDERIFETFTMCQGRFIVKEMKLNEKHPTANFCCVLKKYSRWARNQGIPATFWIQEFRTAVPCLQPHKACFAPLTIVWKRSCHPTVGPHRLQDFNSPNRFFFSGVTTPPVASVGQGWHLWRLHPNVSFSLSLSLKKRPAVEKKKEACCWKKEKLLKRREKADFPSKKTIWKKDPLKKTFFFCKWKLVEKEIWV